MRSAVFSFMVCCLLVFSACTSSHKAQKQSDPQARLELAKKYFEAKKYYRALPLFDELMGYFRGRPEMEDILYHLAWCHYHTDEFLVAAYHFKNYATTYPTEARAEECLFMHARCYYEIAPPMRLDQSYTYDCMNAIQIFANNYPQSRFLADANVMMDDLIARLQDKAFFNAYLYYRMDKYKAAATAFENMLRDYPDAPQAEQCRFLILKSWYLYAANSVPSKQQERFQQVTRLYAAFRTRYPDSIYGTEAEQLYQNALQQLNKLEKNEFVQN
ncbi:MAG: outer membrane protein assembly factor BamD [Chitinophagales bacterium]|nr:outer membrane protein assembly factor BamD [Chitinophagales bacterium]MDW8392926.1 outer membrane protein assembly factor BamD [Chitinophagales bacterium]